MNGMGKRDYAPAVQKCPCLKSHEQHTMQPRCPEDTYQPRSLQSGNTFPADQRSSNFKFHMGKLLKPASATTSNPPTPCDQTPLPPWNPGRRILTFVCVVSVICTGIIIGIVLVAVLLSRHVAKPIPGRTGTLQYAVFRYDEPVSVVPKPQNLVDRTNTIVVHRKNPAVWQSQSRQIKELLDSYRVSLPENGKCHPGGVCPFPVDLISQNCTASDFYGYKTGSPCVALVFRKLENWVPQPLGPEELSLDNVPDEMKRDYDPGLLYVTCKSEHISRDIDIRYSPYHGFPARFFPIKAESLPPLLMLHFPNPPLRTEIWVTCRFWAKNLDQSGNGKLTFKMLVM